MNINSEKEPRFKLCDDVFQGFSRQNLYNRRIYLKKVGGFQT